MSKKAKKKQSAVRKQLAKLSAFIKPVDPELYRFCVDVAGRAITGDLHDCHVPPPPDDTPEGSIYFTDIPMNRAMLAVLREIQHLPYEDQLPVSWRVMHTADYFRRLMSDGRFEDYFRLEDDGSYVDERIFDALAVAPMVVKEEDVTIDVDAVFRSLTEGGAP